MTRSPNDAFQSSICCGIPRTYPPPLARESREGGTPLRPYQSLIFPPVFRKATLTMLASDSASKRFADDLTSRSNKWSRRYVHAYGPGCGASRLFQAPHLPSCIRCRPKWRVVVCGLRPVATHVWPRIVCAALCARAERPAAGGLCRHRGTSEAVGHLRQGQDEHG